MTIVVAKPKLSHSSINLPRSLSNTPARLTAEAALDQAGQEFGAIMLTRTYLKIAGRSRSAVNVG
jgi:hypothetical protein